MRSTRATARAATAATTVPERGMLTEPWPTAVPTATPCGRAEPIAADPAGATGGLHGVGRAGAAEREVGEKDPAAARATATAAAAGISRRLSARAAAAVATVGSNSASCRGCAAID